MDMSETFESIVEVAQAAAERKKAPVYEFHGLPYVGGSDGEVENVPCPMSSVVPIDALSLRSVTDYVNSDADISQRGEKFSIIIRNHESVSVVGDLRPDGMRTTFLRSNATSSGQIERFLGRGHEVEDFIVGLMTKFRPSDDRAALVKAVGNISGEEVQKLSDDGFGQMVMSQSGVKAAWASLPNPVGLVPIRSFPEVILDPVPFIVRAHKADGEKPKMSLSECDGGLWLNDAVGKIRGFIEDGLKRETVSVIG